MKKTNIKTSKAAKKAGLKRIELRHVVEKGGARLENSKVRITINVDADILEYFKKRAEPESAAAYQTQINSELRRTMEEDQSNGELDSHAKRLLNNQVFLEALKEKLSL